MIPSQRAQTWCRRGFPEVAGNLLTGSPGHMTRDDWENVARCARARYAARIAQSREILHWLPEWETWQATLELSGRCPV